MENKEISKRKSRLSNNISSNGKIQPQSLDLEEAILGALMIEPKSIIDVIDLIKPEIFYHAGHQKICLAILSLFNSGRDVDILTVTHELRSIGSLEMVGGAYYITNLTNRVVSAANIRDHIKIVNQKHISRELIRISSEVIQNAYEDTTNDPFELNNETISKLSMLQQGTMERTEQTMQELSFIAMQERDALKGEVKEILGYPTGIKILDKQTLGLKKGELTIIAARPAMGKTAVGVNLAHNLAVENNIPTAFVSLEMKNGSIYIRFESRSSGINSNNIMLNKLTLTERMLLVAADTKLGSSPLILNDSSSMHIDELRAKIIMWVHKYGTKVLIADYLGLFDGTGFSQELKVGYISRTLKKIAMELDIPVIALAQLSRKVEERGNKMPQLSDLRDSGSIEQDADNVWFLYRPEYYGVNYPIEFDELGLKLSAQNLLVIIVAKQRAGETGNVPVHINLSKMLVADHPSTNQFISPPDSSQKTMEIDPTDQSDELPFK